MTQGVTVRLSEKAGRERRGHLTVCQRKKCRAALRPSRRLSSSLPSSPTTSSTALIVTVIAPLIHRILIATVLCNVSIRVRGPMEVFVTCGHCGR